MDSVVVVGGGIAGLESVVALREQGYQGAVTLLCAEPRLPYDRPPLSKEILRGDADESELEADWDELDVDVRLGCAARAVSQGVVQTDAGDIRFDGLVIATGTTPRTLPGGEAHDDVYHLATVEDALALRSRLTSGARVVIIGAGWIGAEVATTTADRGCSVTVIEARDAPLACALPHDVGMLTAPWYAAAGIDLHLGANVLTVEPGQVLLSSGESVGADVIVVGIGIRPQTDWLKGSGIDMDARGYVLVDAGMRTSTPGVVAVGDCTSWESRLFDVRIQMAHWDHALRSPGTAVASLLGADAVYDAVPYFWSDQFGRSLQYLGHHIEGDDVVMRGESSADDWSMCWLRDGRLVALLSVGKPRDISHGRRVIASQHRVDRLKLQDATVEVVEAVAA